MNRKTEFSPMFIRWLIALTVMTLLFAFMQEYWFVRHMAPITPFPSVTAGGITISQGLDMFSGKELREVSSDENTAILLGLLLAFVVGPATLFFSWRRLAVESNKSMLSPANIGFFFGALITAYYVFGIVVVAIIHPQVATSMRSAQALGENRDMVIAGISRVALDAYAYKIMPKAAGGGGGSYIGYRIPETLRLDADGEYLQVEEYDSTITLLGASLEYEGASTRALYGPDGKMSGPFVFLGKYN